MIENEAGTLRKNAAGTGADTHGIVPEGYIARRRQGHPNGSWVGVKPTANLMAMYGSDGGLMFVFDSDLETDMEIPEGDGPIAIAELMPSLAGAFEDSGPGVTYFIGGAVGGIKIGRTTNVAVRLKDIQACSPIPVRVLAIRQGGAIEKRYHKRFAAHRLHGEWFSPHPDILAEIERLSK